VLPAALLAALLVQATGAAEKPQATAPDATPLAVGEDVYRGTLRITVGYWGYSCPYRGDLTLRFQKTRTYTMPVRVIRNPPAGVGVVRERNPFNFLISADPLREGGITLASATVTADPSDGDLTLFEYWRSTLQGSSIAGWLVRSWRQAGLALNVFSTDRLIVPCRPELGTLPKTFQTIKEGARLTGTFTDRRVELTVTGQTFDRERRFTARITASR
jgi:hypothetical protein